MIRKVLPIALLLLLVATMATAAPPPSVWFQDGFDTYATGKLADKSPKWGYALVIEPGKSSAYGGGTTDANVWTGDMGACSGANFVVMKGYQGNWGARTLSDPAAAAAETVRTAPIGWDAQAAGNVQVLYFKMKRAYDELTDPPLHAGIYLIDNALSPRPIMGWVMNAHSIKPQLNLPTYTGPNWTTNRYYSPEGDVYPLPANTDCQEFTAEYDPNTGYAKFYVYVSNVQTLLWSGIASTPTNPAGTGRVSRSLYIRDYGWHGGALADVVYFDDVAVGTTSRPVLTAPLGGAFLTTTMPTVTWTNAFGGMAGYRVRVCSADNPTDIDNLVWDSGAITGSATSRVTGALPTDTHLWAFVNEKYGATWTGWSLQGNGGFYITTAVPTTPTVASPSGTVIGAKPAVVFSDGVLHNQFEVKITTTGDGSGTPVWNSGVVGSLMNGASCAVMLTPGTQYYAFAQATNPVGPSAWSAASAFQVTRAGEGADIRHMEETWGSQNIWNHAAAAPDDGFMDYAGGGMSWPNMRLRALPDPFNGFPDVNGTLANGRPCDWWPGGDGMLRDQPGYYIIPPLPNRTAPSTVLDFWDTGSNWNDNAIMLHRVANIDLDKGVTLTTYASGHCYEGGGCGGHVARQIAQQAQMYVMDDYGTGKCMASFRYGQGEVGICTDAVSWTVGGFTDDQHNPDPRPGQGWHLVRITGRNRIVGDPTSTEWNYYLDENPVPLVSGTGSIDQSVAPYGSIVDAIAIGQGDGGLVGNWQYDWTAVNTDGDYAPGQWGAIGGDYATVSQAKPGAEPAPCSISGQAVITAVVTDENGFQKGFSVQDVDTQDHVGLYLASDNSTNVVVGNKVSGMYGVLVREIGLGAVLRSATFTATTDIADALPIAMPQKSLLGARETAAAGTENAGVFVRITGRVKAIVTTATGGQAVYIDDGTGLSDGRSVDGDSAAKGLRVVFPDLARPFLGEVGKFYRMDGICTCETWIEGSTSRTVETLLGATAVEIPEP